MHFERKSAASVMINSEDMWVTGGEYSKSTEIIRRHTNVSVPGPQLPEVMFEHCAVKINDSHIFLAGNSWGLSR